MALNFGNMKGSATKDKLPQYEWKEGQHSFRIVGDVLPRYIYWVVGENNKDIPMECLGFDRDSETFLNEEKDWVRHYDPQKKCSWGYSAQCLEDGVLKIINFKKTLFEQIMSAVEELGDPTDVETGWDVVYERVKTGTKRWDVKYNLKPFKCKKRPLTEAEKEAIADLHSMDEVLPRPTADQQKELLERWMNPSDDIEEKESIDEDIKSEFSQKNEEKEDDFVDDIPF